MHGAMRGISIRTVHAWVGGNGTSNEFSIFIGSFRVGDVAVLPRPISATSAPKIF
jgi:hypothetical protein